MQEKSVSQAIGFRRSVRIYDSDKPIETNNVKKCIIQATLAPSSSNMQLWEFHHIVSENKISGGTEILSCLNLEIFSFWIANISSFSKSKKETLES